MAAPRRRTVTSSGGAAPGAAMLEALVAGGAEGLLLVEDSAACEGRSLLRAFVTAAVQRAERVLVVLLEVSREQFGAGLSPAVRERRAALLRGGPDPSDPRGPRGPRRRPGRVRGEQVPVLWACTNVEGSELRQHPASSRPCHHSKLL
ncbi:elongator complex protein 5 isoform X2 [Anser cygnoides]|uniref:elongator complex protein 5 isoform X2 n=1 Tax=Anser cygnoides TaxID=8845 RepID=UPI0034D329F3